MLWSGEKSLSVLGLISEYGKQNAAQAKKKPEPHSQQNKSPLEDHIYIMAQKHSDLQQILAELHQALTENPEVTLATSLLDLAVVAIALKHPDCWKGDEQWTSSL